MIQVPLPDSVPDHKQEIEALKQLPFDEFMDKLVSDVVHFAISLAIAVVVFYIGRWIIRKLYDFVLGILQRRNVDASLSTFILSLVRIVLYFILIVSIIGIIGIETGSFLAIFASAGVAIGMALSGTLQNFAGGVLILLLKPYKVGDYIEAQGYAGTVTAIEIFNTFICTADNKTIIVPNGALSTGSINNYSTQERRRVDWTVGISYGDDVARARAALVKMLLADPRVLRPAPEPEPAQPEPQKDDDKPKEESLMERIKDAVDDRKASEPAPAPKPAHLTAPAPVVLVSELADSSVNLSVRAWVATADYWGLFFDFNERIYNELPQEAGVSFPFPQMDVHMDHQ